MNENIIIAFLLTVLFVAGLAFVLFYPLYRAGHCKKGGKHNMRLYAQGERAGMRYGIYECSKCGYNTHPNDIEVKLRNQ